MTPRTVIALLIGLLPAAAAAAELAPSASSATSTEPPPLACRATNDIEPLLVPGHVVLLGELHGTREAPEFVAGVACQALTRGLHVTVALELPTQEEEAVRDPQTPIVELPFWVKEYQDGRTSVAMLELIETVRSWRMAGETVELILLDNPSDFRGRDAHMTKRLLDAVEASPDGFFVALTGNMHNRTAAGSGRMGEGVSSRLGSERVTSLNMKHAGGSAWICEATQGCGPLELGERDADPSGTVTLFETPDEKGFDGIFSVGRISASPPAKSRHD